MYSRAAHVGEDGSLSLGEDDRVALIALQVLGVDQVGDVALNQGAILAVVHIGILLSPRFYTRPVEGNIDTKHKTKGRTLSRPYTVQDADP